MLELKNITRTFVSGSVETRVLKGISLTIKEREFVAIVGPSGAGKSTLLYQMSLLDHPTSGSVSVDGEDITDLKPEEGSFYRLNNFGIVFQDYALVPELTAEENVALPDLMRGVERLVAMEKARQVLEKFDMGHAYGKLPSQLSGGEQQRVSVARAIAGKPKLLFADEPTANLDSERSIGVIETLKKLNEEGQTIIMVTHELEYARMANRIIEIRDGVLVSDTKTK